MFTVYLGEVPEDVILAVVHLNGEGYELPFANQSSHAISKVTYANNSQGYTLKVPFDHPVVERKVNINLIFWPRQGLICLLTLQLIKEEAVLQLILHIKYTLIILPEDSAYYHQADITALVPHFCKGACFLHRDQQPTDLMVCPSASLDFNASCLDSGISFTLELNPLWQITIGSDVLTKDLAAQRGYIMTADGQRLQLDVPLFTTGYTYNVRSSLKCLARPRRSLTSGCVLQNATLTGLSGTFEILVQHAESSEVHSYCTKTCQFSLSEYICKTASLAGRQACSSSVSLTFSLQCAQATIGRP